MIEARDSASIYTVPLDYHRQGLDAEVLAHFHMTDAPAPNLERWERIGERLAHPDGEVTVAVVGKYTVLKDAYKSLIEALVHGGVANNVKVNLDWVESEVFEGVDSPDLSRLEKVSAVLVPGGFRRAGLGGQDPRGAVRPRARRAVLRHLLRHADGDDRGGPEPGGHPQGVPPPSSAPRPKPVVGLMTEWVRGNRVETRGEGDAKGGTMRLGAFDAVLTPGSRVSQMYGATDISERHRHRYEVNIGYRDRIEATGLRFTGLSPDGVLPEIVERDDHPWFVGVQFHPELKSRPFAPHPLFTSFIAAAKDRSRLV